MAAAASATPPLPPDVTGQQQGSPLAQYAEGAQQQAPPPQSSGVEMIEVLMNEVAEKLDKIAQVANMVDPTLIEYVKKMGQVGSEAMKEIQMSKQKQKQSQGAGPRAGLEPTKAPPEGPANAIAA